MKVQEVKDEDIFSFENSLTNLIKGKKLRKKLYDNGIKVAVEKVNQDMGLGFGLSTTKLVFTFYLPETLKKDFTNEVVHEVSEVITRKHDIGCRYNYVRY